MSKKQKLKEYEVKVWMKEVQYLTGYVTIDASNGIEAFEKVHAMSPDWRCLEVESWDVVEHEIEESGLCPPDDPYILEEVPEDPERWVRLLVDMGVYEDNRPEYLVDNITAIA